MCVCRKSGTGWHAQDYYLVLDIRCALCLTLLLSDWSGFSQISRRKIADPYQSSKSPHLPPTYTPATTADILHNLATPHKTNKNLAYGSRPHVAISRRVPGNTLHVQDRGYPLLCVTYTALPGVGRPLVYIAFCARDTRYTRET